MFSYITSETCISEAIGFHAAPDVVHSSTVIMSSRTTNFNTSLWIQSDDGGNYVSTLEMNSGDRRSVTQGREINVVVLTPPSTMLRFYDDEVNRRWKLDHFLDCSGEMGSGINP
jgi:hypothetical protein